VAPNVILDTLRMIQRIFLWKGNKEGHKISLVSSKKVYNPKRERGLGLRYPAILDKVLSAKISWRWLEIPNIFGNDFGGRNTPPQSLKESSSSGRVKTQGRSSRMRLGTIKDLSETIGSRNYKMDPGHTSREIRGNKLYP
jgi:hypothetical protein